jgi:hypothetical protein
LHSTGGLSLNHGTTSSLGLRSTPKSWKSTPDLHWRNTLRVDPYAHQQHVKVLKHFAYISYGCGIHSTGGLSLNHGITSSLRLSSTPKSWKSTPDLHWRNTLRVDPYAHPQHSKVLKHFAYICNDCEMQSKGVWRADQQTKQQEYPPKTDIS